MNLRHVLLVMRMELLDARRTGGILLLVLVVPLCFSAFVTVVPGIAERREERRLQTRVYDVAVDADADAARLVRDAAGRRFRVRQFDDAREAVLERTADIGVLVRPGAVAGLDDGRQVRVDLVYVQSRSDSQRAFGLLDDALRSAAVDLASERLTERGLPGDAAEPVRPEVVDLSTSAEGSRIALARVAPLLLAFPLLQLTSVIARRISGRKDKRDFEPLLLLPIARRDLVLGISLVGGLFGVASVPAMLIPLAAVTRMPFSQSGAPASIPGRTIPFVLASMFLFALAATCVGVLAGAAAREGGSAGAIIGFLQPLLTGAAMALQFTSIYVHVWPVLIPAVGPLALLQLGLADTASAWHVGVAALGTLATCGALLWLAVRFVESDRSVLRATS